MRRVPLIAIITLFILIAAAIASSRSTTVPAHEQALILHKNNVELPIKEPTLVYFTDSGSMKPVINKNTRGILEKTNQALKGDIIVYKYNNRNIVHRVIDIKYDSNGIYYETKGDNLIFKDPVKVRPYMIIGKIVALIY